ncbi:hypothetical protein JZ751_006024, partial [Albula glossodonta]
MCLPPTSSAHDFIHTSGTSCTVLQSLRGPLLAKAWYCRFPIPPRPPSVQSTASSTDSEECEDNYVAMVVPNMSADEPLSLLSPLLCREESFYCTVPITPVKREVLGLDKMEENMKLSAPMNAEGGSSPMVKPKGDKQVEYLDLDLDPGKSTPPRKKKSSGTGSTVSDERVDYVVVDQQRTQALKNTREAWSDGRQSTETDSLSKGPNNHSPHRFPPIPFALSPNPTPAHFPHPHELAAYIGGPEGETVRTDLSVLTGSGCSMQDERSHICIADATPESVSLLCFACWGENSAFYYFVIFTLA